VWLRWDSVAKTGWLWLKVRMVLANMGMLRWDSVAKIGMDVGKAVWCD
jgi:hypothetical protein